jgi:hypothetical protein
LFCELKVKRNEKRVKDRRKGRGRRKKGPGN